MKARTVLYVAAAKKGAHAGTATPPPRFALGLDPTPGESIPGYEGRSGALPRL
jgi:hypothetical protein